MTQPAPDRPALAHLLTEARNPRSEDLDTLPTLDLLRLLNDEDATVDLAVRAELPRIAAVVDQLADRLPRGGRLIYLGAGTSGRLGVLDASECPPTFSVSPTVVQGLIAGGDSALRRSSEAAEDSPEQGAADLAALSPPLNPLDTVVGIAASGRTPWVLGALAHARAAGALTVALACTPGSPLEHAADLPITPLTGPEVLTGSTRLKAGTATKLVLNMLSTAAMVRSGMTFGNLMVNLQPTNAKLLDRAERILIAATGCTPTRATELLREAGGLPTTPGTPPEPGAVKLAILMQLTGMPYAAARARLKLTGGRLRQALTP